MSEIEVEASEAPDGKQKRKKGKKKAEKKFNAPIVIPSSTMTKQEYQSQMMLAASQTQYPLESSTKSNLVLGAGSSKILKSKPSKTKSKSKNILQSFLQLTQVDEESYSSGSSTPEEEKQASKKKHVAKGKIVKLSIDEDGIDIGAELDKKPPKKPKKEKKGKSKKAGKMEKVKPEEEEEEDIMLTIMKLQPSATAPSESITETEEGKESKKKKKSSGKKKKDRNITPQMAEQLKMEAEQEAIRQAELEKIRLAEERLIAIEKEKKETLEAQIRVEQLSKTNNNIQKALDHYREATKAEREEEEWKLFVECGNLPNPYFCDQMNTYLHIWEDEIENTNVSDISIRTENTLKLIGSLEELITMPPEAEDNSEKLKNWLWIRQLYIEHQQMSLDIATYRLLRNVSKNLVRLDIPTADYNYKDPYVTLCLWLRVQLPTPLPNPRRPPKPRIDITFKNLNGLQVILPATMDLEKMALRVMNLTYDHLSDNCEFFDCPTIPGHYDLDLKESCKKEWRIKLQYKYDNRDKKARPVIDPENENAVILVPEPEEFASDEDIPQVPYKKLEPTASQYACSVEEKLYAEAREQFLLDLPQNVVNLRKYVILGGVYHINLLHQPPQPQDYVILDLNITRLFVPKQLEHVDFFTSYTPPVPSDPDVRKAPEELEEEMKKNEEALDSLIYISLTWPKHVIFLELPIVCIWDDKEKYWTNKYIHDLKHNEEKGTLSFRSQVFGIFGLASLKYSNLPYQAWEIKPEENGSINISITSAILIFEFKIQDGKICLIWVQNSPNDALKSYIGKYMKLYTLKKVLKETGINIFPEHDAFCYVEGCCEKQWPMEKNLYCNMAALSGCFNFAWSRWNLTLGRRSIVLLMREYSFDKSKQKNYSTLLVTPTNSTIINCTEVSQEFSDEPVESIKFSADLYNLMKTISGIAVRKKVGEFSKLNIYTVSEFLIATRILSFS
ncbi:dynein axonemal intermediate chain 7-like [Diorhabda carinulata]|uniref:dynein axonemal intermediate chain 7-like n=1 Tax=Diorhabda carinulata TaxID=1163345 RepID=UPI0025A256BC|nr:dynein axonemal intermediate chain 7-like [Diorhabda carinulata]